MPGSTSTSKLTSAIAMRNESAAVTPSTVWMRRMELPGRRWRLTKIATIAIGRKM